MLEPAILTRRSAFSGLMQSVESGQGAGVVVSERFDIQIATVIARQGHSVLAELVRSANGIDLPAGPKRVA